MRFLLALVGIAAIIVIAMMALGMMTLQTKPGSLPSVSVAGGSAPEVHANVATISVGTENQTVTVPTVTTTQKTIAVPSIHVNKPGDGTTNTAAPQ
jgi:uncharacterized protein YggE